MDGQDNRGEFDQSLGVMENEVVVEQSGLWGRKWRWVGVVIGLLVLSVWGLIVWRDRDQKMNDGEYNQAEKMTILEETVVVVPTIRVVPSVTPTPSLEWNRVVEEGAVSPDGRWVVMIRSDWGQEPNDGSERWRVWELLLGDMISGKIVKRWGVEELLFEKEIASDVKVLGWKRNSMGVWLAGTAGSYIGPFFVLDSETKEILVVGDRGRGFEIGEMDLNLETGEVVAGTYTFKFDEYDYRQYLETEKMERLQVIDLYTGEEKVVMEAKTHIFEPKWIDEETIEFDGPGEEGRIRKGV